MQIIREGMTNVKWSKDIRCVPSFYNISLCNNNKCAIFNSATGSVVVMDEVGFENCTSSELEYLVKLGFLVPSEMEEHAEYTSKVKISEKGKPEYFTIIPTTACNARCFYCYEEDYCKQTANENTLNAIIQLLNKNLDDDSACILDWYGGEPLLCITQIDKIISVLKENGKLQNRWLSSITTNGTLLSKDVVRHLVEEWHLESAHITIDGTEDEHNRRKNVNPQGESAFRKTYNGIYELLSAGVYVNLRIHIDHDNKSSFCEILNELSELFQFDNLHLFPTYLFPPEDKMPDNYIKDSEKEEIFYELFKTLISSNYKVDLKDLFPNPRHSGCFATKKNTMVIAPDGTTHTCVQDFTSNDRFKDQKYSDFSYALNSCKQCKYLPICLGGCLYNRNLSNTVRTPCVRNRFIVKPLLKILLESLKKSETG